MSDYEPDLEDYDSLADWLHEHTLVAGETQDGSFVFVAF